MSQPLATALKRFETLITRPAESFADAHQRLTEFNQRLERTRRLIDALGNPDARYHTIHIAGTSGKGSIAMMCEAMLLAAGHQVGSHISPYLQTPLEKVRINGRLMSAHDAIVLTDAIMDAVEQVESEHPYLAAPQYTEAWLAMALRYFADKGCVTAIVEVGMGGRYDATNILLPKTSVISTVHYDHVRVLGDTLPEIAHHKAGVLKAGVPAVVGRLVPEAMSVVEAEGERIGARLIRLGKEIDFVPKGVANGQGYFSYRGLTLDLQEVEVALTGTHQLENAATAVAALEVYSQTQGFQLDEEAVRTGLASVRFAGRLEVMQREPTVVLDGAHNEEKMGALVATLREVFDYDRLIVVLGMLEAKNASPIVQLLSGIADEIITTAPDVRGKPAISAERLAKVARIMGAHNVRDGGAPMSALQEALSTAKARDLVVVTGSLSTLR